jgi:hypothetical protein
MAKSNPKPSSNDNKVKAGKKKSYIAPPPVNQDKRDRRLLGEQQFHSKINFTEEVTVIKFKDGVMTAATKHVPIPFKYDPTRKQIVYNTFYVHGKGNGQDKK